MKASDVAVKWMDRIGHFTIAATIALQLRSAFEHHSFETAKIPVVWFMVVTVAWLYALWSRERKTPLDQEHESCDAEQPSLKS